MWASCDPVKLIHKMNYHRWKANEMNTTTALAGCLKRDSRLWHREDILRWSPTVSRAENLGKPRGPEFTELSSREVGSAQKENPRSLERGPLKCHQSTGHHICERNQPEAISRK